MDTRKPHTSVFDVCLILEGTYPYIVGGVSNWTHALLNGLPEVDFALVHLGRENGDSRNRALAYTPAILNLE